MHEKVIFKKDVKEALDSGKPVIALESTIIAHGMPYPQNVKTAKELEDIARSKGVTPATIAVMDGFINIGLTNDQIEDLASAREVMKVSRRDFAFAVTKKKIGATTVAGTMYIANMVGINIFATGGIGGVHRDCVNTFDISADLMEFSKTPVLVVSAGAKAILDLPKTLEVLETLGVPVIGYKTFEFPAFYSQDSDIKLHLRLDKASDIAKMFKDSLKLGMNNGIIIANPIPRKDQIPQKEMDKYIEMAMSDLKVNRIKGKEVTPFLLSRIVKHTSGSALNANIALVKNNVELACDIALEMSNSFD